MAASTDGESLLLMSQLVGRVPGFIFVPPHPVFFDTSLVLPPTSHPFYFAGFFPSLPHPTGLVSRHPLTQRKKS